MPYFFEDQNGNYYEAITDVETPAGHKAVPKQAPPEPSVEELTEDARLYRTLYLSRSDWTQLPDAPVDQAAWAEYRQALRDVPQQEGFPDNIVWPTEPE